MNEIYLPQFVENFLLPIFLEKSLPTAALALHYNSLLAHTRTEVLNRLNIHSSA